MMPAASTQQKTMTRQAGFSILFMLAGLALAPVRIVLLTRVLSEADYGIFNLLTMTVASIGFVALLGQRQYLIYALPGKSLFQQGRHVWSSLAVTVLSGLLFALAFLGASRVFPVFRDAFSVELVGIGAIFIALYAVAQLGMGYLLATGEVVRYRLQVFLTSNLWMVALIPALLWFAPSLGQLAWLWLAGLALPMIWIFRWSLRSLGEGVSARPVPALMRESARYGLPLISRNIANSLMRLVDRYAILHFMGATQVGLYTLPIMLVSYAADTVYFLEFFFPHISSRWQANRALGKPGCTGEAADYFHLALRICLLVAVPMAVGVFLWGGGLVRLLAGASYASVSFLFALLVGQIVLIPLSHFLHFAMMLDGRTDTIGRTIIVSTLVNLGLNLLLIPAIGLAGAALAGTISYAVLVLSSLWAGRLLPYLRVAALRPVPLALATAAMAAAAWALRRATGGNMPAEMVSAMVVFLAAGHLGGLWTTDEIRYILRRRKQNPGLAA
jgi:O-antigen/teichoic acid export membrane protein